MKKSSRKTTFLSALAIAVPAMGMAQDKVEASVGADLVSGYIWRGQDLGGVSIQPTLSVSYKGSHCLHGEQQVSKKKIQKRLTSH